jgi:hypothetical protein
MRSQPQIRLHIEHICAGCGALRTRPGLQADSPIMPHEPLGKS